MCERLKAIVEAVERLRYWTDEFRRLPHDTPPTEARKMLQERVDRFRAALVAIEPLIERMERVQIDGSATGEAKGEDEAVPSERMDDGWTPGQLAGELDIATGTLNSYAKRAKVTTPGRGDREHRYLAADVCRICEVMEQEANSGNRETAKQLRLRIEIAMKSR